MRSILRGRPVSLALAAVTLLAALLTGAAVQPPDAALRAHAALHVAGLFQRGDVVTLLTSVLLADSPAELLVVLAALVVVVGACERLLGSARTLLAWAVTAVVGGVVGTALQAAGALARGFWTTPPLTSAVLHPETPVLGVLMATSAFTGPFWRRRIRVVGFSALVVLLLYSGQPEDLDHLAGAVAGLLLGALLARHLPALSLPRSSHREARTLLAAVVAVTAVGPVVAVVQPVGYGLLRPLGRLFRDPLPLPGRVLQRCAEQGGACGRTEQLAHLNGPGAVLLAVAPLVVLLVAAVGIRRGRRAGIWLAAGVELLLAVLAALFYGLLPVLGDPDQVRGPRGEVTAQAVLAVLVPLGVAAAAVRLRRHCPVLPARRVLLVGGVVLVAAVVGTAALFVAVGMLVPRQFTPVADPLSLLSALPERFVPTGFLRFHRVVLVPAGPVAAALTDWTGTVAWLVLLAVATAVLGSTRRASRPRERARLAQLLAAGSSGSLGWMATWPGNHLWFSADGRHAVAYRDAAGVALALGQPVGGTAGEVDAAREFARFCDDRGLAPVFYAVPPEFAAAVAEGGPAWATVPVGEDTLIDPGAFSMRGKHWQDVRSSFNRADRAGIRAEWTDWDDLPLGRRVQLQAISEEWIADKRLPELGFTLGGLAELRDRQVRLMLAVGPDDRVEAVTSWLPTRRDGEVVGLTLDFMRRRIGSPNGIMEFLIASVISAAQQRGLEFVSLSVAPLQGAPEHGDDRLGRVLQTVARVLEPAYGFRSLAAYKEKFKPQHRPVVLAVPDAAALPAVALAVARAYLPDRPLAGLARPLPRPAARRDAGRPAAAG